MGTYLNPGNAGFEQILNGHYVDKTGLITVINDTLNKPTSLSSLSRPRRFGKSYAAQMLCAYYDHTCDSHALFDGLEISRSDSYELHINQYHVIYLDMGNLLGTVRPEALISYIKQNVTQELLTAYPNIQTEMAFDNTLIQVVNQTNRKFVMIIDEWDAPIREAPQIEKDYLYFLRMLFKGSGTTAKIFAGAYMTGILPIKKDGSQSAISDFREYSILDPGVFAEYTGFTEQEVKQLCEEYGMDFAGAKQWYDGYSFDNTPSVYNPYSVMTAMQRKKYRSYWQKTSAAESLPTYINLNFEGLQEDVIRLIAGEKIEVYTDGFENDLTTFRTKDDVLTLMIHLGYLAYDEATRLARIPNEEVRSEFHALLRKGTNTGLIRLIHTSEQLLADTLAGDETAVAKAIEVVRESNYAPVFYNDEQSLRYVIKFAYIVCVDRYLKIEELPTGKGIADVVFLPKHRTPNPAIVVELKWNKTAEAAIAQIKSKNYPTVLSGYSGEVVLVGLNYDDKTKQHACKIEKTKM